VGKRTNISAILQHQGRSDRWFYQRMGVSESLFYAIEKGERRPTEEYQRKAAELLDIPIELLFFAHDSSGDVESPTSVDDAAPLARVGG